MLMMDVGEMFVRVFCGIVPVRVAVRFIRRSVRRVFVPVMCVVRVPVFVFKRRMRVFVFVVFGQVKINSDSHQSRRDCQRNGQRIAQKSNRNQRSDKWRQ